MPNIKNTAPTSDFRETVCINTDRIYDCCKDRDCMQDLRVYLPDEYQELLDGASNIKPIGAEVLWSYIDVEPLAFNRGFYTVDIRFYIRVIFDICTGQSRSQRLEGCATFSKKAVLYGSEGEAKIFTSEYVPQGCDRNYEARSNRPRATVEVLDPMVLSVRISDPCDPCGCDNADPCDIPEYICNCFNGPLREQEGRRKLYVTLGLFSIVRLMREVQLLIPACDFCIPEKESCYPSEEDPCGMFGQLEFPLDQFFPPNRNGNCADDGCCN